MSTTRCAISWIYGEFQIALIKQGELTDSWTAPYPVCDLNSLTQAMSEASEHIDLIHSGNVSIAYEDDLHTHEFFNLPKMAKKDLEKVLLRKVEKNKPFDDNAAWCYHEANHGDNEEGILLHLMPQDIVDAIVCICQDFYLTPKRMVPLTEVVAEIIPTYTENENENENNIVIVVALFNERTEIITSLANGEVLYVRELPYSGYGENKPRLITDINRTLSYSQQQFSQQVKNVWLIGKETDQIQNEINDDIEAQLHYDKNGLNPFFWATAAANLSGQLSANFIPLLARKKINSALFYRVALWFTALVSLIAIGTSAQVGYASASKYISDMDIESNITNTNNDIFKFEALQERRDIDKQKLKLLQADAHNLPALFINHLSKIVPDGLTLLRSEVLFFDNQWRVTLQGESNYTFSETVAILQKLESNLESSPWNMTITKSWKSSWYEQLQSGSASNNNTATFEIIGLMQ